MAGEYANGATLPSSTFKIELETKVREDFIITVKAPTRLLKCLLVLSHLQIYHDTKLTNHPSLVIFVSQNMSTYHGLMPM